MRPSFYGSEKMSSTKPLEQLWHKSISCPEGTIPILRTRSDLPKAISLKGFGTNDLKPQMEVSYQLSCISFDTINIGMIMLGFLNYSQLSRYIAGLLT